MNRPIQSQSPEEPVMKSAARHPHRPYVSSLLAATFVVAGCHDGTSGGSDAGEPRPSLECDPSTTAGPPLCTCMASIVCDQIYYCLAPSVLAGKPADWSPISSCISTLESDCIEDLESGSDAVPADFPQCIRDLANTSCTTFDNFNSVSMNFPPSCNNLRALDTGLGIGR